VQRRTHGRSGRFTISELSAIRTRIEAAIGFVHMVVALPAIDGALGGVRRLVPASFAAVGLRTVLIRPNQNPETG
jgi:hypothetical protein